MYSRRTVLQRFSIASLPAIFGAGFFGEALATTRDVRAETATLTQDYYESLIKLEPDLAKSQPRTNLFQAWEEICPAHFHEFVFVTWCATRFELDLDMFRALLNDNSHRRYR